MIKELTTKYGKILVPDTDTAQFSWFEKAGASPEDQYIEQVTGLVKERAAGIFIDVGANFGTWTLAMASHVNHVLAFEPQRRIAALLSKSVELNGLKNVSIHQAACAATVGRLAMPDIPLELEKNFGGVSLYDKIDPTFQTYMVDLVALDDCVHSSTEVALIKIDVEGYEISVLKGAYKVIMRCRPILFVESDHPNTSKPLLVEYLMVDLHYECEQMGPNLLCLPI